MNLHPFRNDTFASRVTFCHLLVFVIALPFDRLYSELTLISLVIHTALHARRSTIRPIPLASLWIPAAVYLLTLAGTLYTHYYAEAFYEWERQLAILLFPLLFFFNPIDLNKCRLPVLLALAVSCTLTLSCLYARVFLMIYTDHLPLAALFSNAFINHNFAQPIEMHATYFSMYIALSAVTAIYFLLRPGKKIARILSGIMLLVLMAGLVQLSSRAVLIAFALILNLVIPLLLLPRRNRVAFIFIAILFSLSGIYTITRIDNLKSRFIVELKEDLTQASIRNNTLEPRIVRWQSSWPLVKRSLLYGYGSGSELPVVKEGYFQRKLYNSYVNGLNAHNEYLSILIKTGVIGLLVFLYALYRGFRVAVKRTDVFFCSFLVIIASVSFSENILDGTKGVFFFAFFFSLFYLPDQASAGASENRKRNSATG
ncbi:MAG: O-antigen ligase family protein [Sediminibacterium sp.]|nr:O-antigen ligase family protein [Sediminibacterium sp.]